MNVIAPGSQAGSANASVIRIEADGPEGIGLSEWETMDPKALASGNPVQRGYLYDEGEEAGYSAGVWDCTAFDDAPGPYPVDEYMLLLEGTVIMEMPDGTEITINAGEAFVIPKGLNCQWKMPGYVRKIFMILEKSENSEAENPSLNRVTTPDMSSPENTTPDTIMNCEGVFQNADGRMSVTMTGFPQGLVGPVLSSARRIVSVLAGSVEINGSVFEPGDSFLSGRLEEHVVMIIFGSTKYMLRP